MYDIYLLLFLAGIGLLASGQADAVIAGGVEFMSDVPIRWGRKLRQMALKMNRTKGLQNQLSLLIKTLASKPAFLEVELIFIRIIFIKYVSIKIHISCPILKYHIFCLN